MLKPSVRLHVYMCEHTYTHTCVRSLRISVLYCNIQTLLLLPGIVSNNELELRKEAAFCFRCLKAEPELAGATGGLPCALIG